MGIGARIFQAAKYRGFTDSTAAITEICTAADVSRQMVYSWQKDVTKDIMAGNALALARRFNVRLEWLVDGSGEMTARQQALLPSEIDKLWAAVPEELKPHYVALMQHAAQHALKFELNYAKLVHQDAFLDQDRNYREFEERMQRINHTRGGGNEPKDE